jgi:hypothetical protein
VDLVLSKMMRSNDPQDMADIEFMLRHDQVSENQILEAFDQIRPIELPELRVAFARAKPIVLHMVRGVV